MLWYKRPKSFNYNKCTILMTESLTFSWLFWLKCGQDNVYTTYFMKLESNYEEKESLDM